MTYEPDQPLDTISEIPISHEIAKTTAQLCAEHHDETAFTQQVVDRLTSIVGHPAFLVGLTAAIILWIAGNLFIRHLGLSPVDPPPFDWLQGTLSAAGLYVAALILSTQRREDQLSSYREQLSLELSILNDQKTSKIIELLEEGRRDNPMISDRVDSEAQTMSTPSDAHSVLVAIKEVMTDVVQAGPLP